MTPEIRDLVRVAALRFQLDPRLVEAQVIVESGGDPTAWNPEPAYRYFWNVRTQQPFRALREGESADERAPDDFPSLAGDRDQEWWAQQASWGILQVMGAVARELGCRVPYLTALCYPEVGLEYGCRKLQIELDFAGDVRTALAAYNGGRFGNRAGRPLRNTSYADAVLQQRDRLHA